MDESPIGSQILIRWIMRWIVIYPVDSAIQRLNSRNLAFKIHTHFH